MLSTFGMDSFVIPLFQYLVMTQIGFYELLSIHQIRTKIGSFKCYLHD